MPEIDRLANEEGVQRVRTDMCQFGMMSRTSGVGTVLGHVLKPTGFLTNSKHIARELSRRCPRDHDHVPLVGGRVAAAAIYPHDLCCAICRGLSAQTKEDAGFRIESPLLDKGGVASLSSLCKEATTVELNDKYKEERSARGYLNEVGSVPIGDHVFDLVQNAKADNVNVLQSLTSMLRSTVSQFKVHRKLNPLTGLPRSDDVVPRSCSVQRACISFAFDLNVVQMEVEGRRTHQQVDSGGKD